MTSCAIAVNSADFLKSPFRTFFSLWVPVLFSLIAEPVTGLVDTAFVARLGAGELAALGVGTMVLSGVFWIFNFLSVGSQTEVSQALGRREMERGERIASLAMLLALCAGMALMLMAWLFATPVAAAMGAADAVHRHAVVYIQWRAAGAPAVLLTLTAFGVLYGLQDMRMPFLIDVRRLMKVGADMFVRTGALTLFLLLATRAATRLGPEAGAAHQAIRQVWVFTALFLDASAITAQSLIGWFVGSGRIGDGRKVAGFVCLWSTLVGTMLAAAMLGGGHAIAMFLVPPSALALFFPAWTAAALIQPIGALAFVTDGIHWGTGDFRYLRNVVVLATACGAGGIWMLEGGSPRLLTGIWWVTGAWIAIRACFGMLRIWPAIGKSPLRA